MQFRLIDLFKWTTVIGVSLPLAIWFATTLIRLRPAERPGFLVGCTLLSAFVVVSVRYLATDRHDRWTVTGLCVGIAAGVFIGANSGLGLWAIETFNPDLPPRDFEMTFGVIVGSIAGAFIGTLICGVAGAIWRWIAKQKTDC